MSQESIALDADDKTLARIVSNNFAAFGEGFLAYLMIGALICYGTVALLVAGATLERRSPGP
jgi:hypothetical protein